VATAFSTLVSEDVLAVEEMPEPTQRNFTLTASEFDWALMDDVGVRVWGYNGQMPGPELRVREGDIVRVTLNNKLPVPTTIHWHGVNVGPAMDGVAGLSQVPVAPGEAFVYEFVANPAGTRWYHSHTDPALQVHMGLYGPLIIEPRTPSETWDREYTLMLAEWDLELNPAVAAGTAPPGPKDRMLRGGELGADLFLINGRMHGAIPPLRLARDERILLRMIHAGAIPHPMHTHGHSFTIVATDGNPVSAIARLTKDTLLIGPAERYDLSITGNNPGVWMVHCHIEHHMANGMMTTLWYDGEQPTGPVAGFAAGASMGSHFMHDAAAHQAATTAPWTGADEVEITMLDDRFAPRAAAIVEGATVTWINKGRNWHSVAAFDGSFQSGKIEPGERFSFRFTRPGTYQYLCKHHGMQGMVGSVTVEPAG
jgi:FtsP/CotA-like multicopper oxidase with cupredoxin domain